MNSIDAKCRSMLYVSFIMMFGFTLLAAANTQHGNQQGHMRLRMAPDRPNSYEILRSVANETDFNPATDFESEQEGLAFLFVRFLRAIHSNSALPYEITGDVWGSSRGDLARTAISHFFNRGAEFMSGASNRCLEWEIRYLEEEPFASRCKEKWSFEYSQMPRIDQAKMTVYGNLDSLPADITTALVGFFDVIVCTQVFEHVGQPFESAKAIYSMTSDDGLLFFSAPFLSRYHIGAAGEDPSNPLDHFRYTLAGGQHLLRDVAGFELIQQWVAGGSLLTTAHLLGLGINDFSEQEMQELLFEPTDLRIGTQNDLYFNVFFTCRKVPQ